MAALSKILRSVQGGQVSFMCPGCEEAHAIPITGERAWAYNNNPDAPTFMPSILVRRHTWTPPVTGENLDEWKRSPWPQKKVESVCHSFVENGRIRFLDDCTHALAGQTVDLPEFNHG